VKTASDKKVRPLGRGPYGDPLNEKPQPAWECRPGHRKPLWTGIYVRPGDLGENITTRRIDLPALPQGMLPRIGDTVVEITGLRTPCSKIERFRKELRRAVTEHRHAGPGTVKSAVMAIVGNGGVVRRDDRIGVIIPRRPHRTLEPV
jgi:MOSC domain-containing protein YiiM